MVKLSAIVAMDKNRVIGYQNQMPWHLPADLKHFRNITMGHPIIMGRNTYDSIGKPLPGRLNIVITRRPLDAPPEVKVVNNFEDALKLVQEVPEAFIIGGQQIFQLAMPYVQRYYLTFIDHEFSGDTWFPELDKNEWHVISTESHIPDEKNHFPYRFDIIESL